MIDGFSIGPLYIRFYGILLMLGALAGGFLATIEVKRRGHDPEMVWDLLVYLIIGGVIGARVWHILTPPPSSIAQGFTTAYYLTHPLDAVAIWKGGLGIPGTIIGGLVAMYLYARGHRQISFLEWSDIAAPSLALGQAIGRWGNFFNQELYGAPTDLPWKIFIDPAHRLAGYQDVAFYHPLFAYESILNVANMLLLLWILRRFSGSLKRGEVFNIYLIVYPLIRFGLDFLRLDASQLFNVDINQAVSAVIAVLAVIVLLWRRRSPQVPEAPAASNLVEAVPARTADELPAPDVKVAPRRRVVRKTAAKRSVTKRAIGRRTTPTKRTRRSQ
jgi:phosphatidylglycerol---prolipoprotein diacylglyceryl transferase